MLVKAMLIRKLKAKMHADLFNSRMMCGLVILDFITCTLGFAGVLSLRVVLNFATEGKFLDSAKLHYAATFVSKNAMMY